MITLDKLPADAPLPPGTIRIYKTSELFDPPPHEWSIHDEGGLMRGASLQDMLAYLNRRKAELGLSDTQVQTASLLAENFPGVQLRSSGEIHAFKYSSDTEPIFQRV